jgi:hypothetical protein
MFDMGFEPQVCEMGSLLYGWPSQMMVLLPCSVRHVQPWVRRHVGSNEWQYVNSSVAVVGFTTFTDRWFCRAHDHVHHQIMRIVNNVRPDRQTVLFSATFPRAVETLARKVR